MEIKIEPIYRVVYNNNIRSFYTLEDLKRELFNMIYYEKINHIDKVEKKEYNEEKRSFEWISLTLE